MRKTHKPKEKKYATHPQPRCRHRRRSILRAYRPGQIINGAYQYGAIGPDVGYTVGVAAAGRHGIGAQADFKGHPIVAITGDAGFGYTAMELETLSKYRLPAILVVYNNNAWGTCGRGARRMNRGAPMEYGDDAYTL